MIQLDFFSSDEMSLLNSNFNKCKESSDKVRKAVFAGLEEVKKKVVDQQAQISELRFLMNEMHQLYKTFNLQESKC